jgi:hypothetical protein
MEENKRGSFKSFEELSILPKRTNEKPVTNNQ